MRLSLILLLCITLQCKSRSASPSLTRDAEGSRSCAKLHPLSNASAWRYWPLPKPAVPFPLPRGFRSLGINAKEADWLGADSSEIAYTVTDRPLVGASGTSALLSRLRHPSYRLEGECHLEIAHRAAVINMFQHVDSAKTDTVFGFVAEVTIGPGAFASVLALTPSLAMRDSLIGSVGLLDWRR